MSRQRAAIGLAIPGEMSPVGLTLPKALSFEQWELVVVQLAMITKACMWWWGDAVNYGEHKWGEKYKAALDCAGYDYQSLRNAAWVSSRIQLSRRRGFPLNKSGKCFGKTSVTGCPYQKLHSVFGVDKKGNASSRAAFHALNFPRSESNCRPAEVQEAKALPELEHPCSTSDKSLGGAPFVAMMQPANLRDFDHLA